MTETQILSGNIQLALSHVVPDLVQKVLKGQDPAPHLSVTAARSVATPTVETWRTASAWRSSRLGALNEDFNLSTPQATTVRELAELIWRKVRGDEPFRYVSDKPYTYDVQRRIPSVEKAKRLLGFEARTTLDQALDEIIPWIRDQIEVGGI